MTDVIDAIRREYGVVYRRGDRVTVNGKPGVITGGTAQYLRVLFDDQAYVSNVHPTWKVLKVKS